MRIGLIVHLVRTVSWPHWREHFVRTVLTVVGIAAGVTMIVAIANVNDSLVASFRRTLDTMAGVADLEVVNGGSGVDASLLPRVRALPGVRAAGGMVEAFVPLADDPGEQVLLLGVDFLDDASAWNAQFPRDRTIIDDTIEFVSRGDSIAVPRRLLERRGWRVGSAVRLATPVGVRTLTVRGVVDGAGPADLFGGALVLMDLPAAQRLLARDGLLDRIVVVATPSADVAALRTQVATEVGARATVGVPDERGEQAERLLLSLRTMLAIMSVGAVIVGTFIVHLTVVVSVRQRRRVLAILSAVGIRRRSLVALCLVETLVLAVVGAAAGIVVGEGLARLVYSTIGGVASQVWTPVDARTYAQSAGGLLAAVALGICVATAAAFVAVRGALGVPTIEALRPTSVEEVPAGSSWRRWAAASALLAGAWAIALAPRDVGFGGIVAGVLLTHSSAYLGAALLAPLAVVGAARLAAPLVRNWRGFSLRFAVENLGRNRTLHGQTVSALMAAFAIAVVVVGLVASLTGAMMHWITAHFDADLYVGRGDRFRLRAGPPMSDDTGRAIAAIDGVAAVEPFRVIPITVHERPAFLQSVSLGPEGSGARLPMVDGTFAEAEPALRDGSGALVSENLAFHLGLRRGDTITVPAPAGERRLRVVGIFDDYLGSLDHGSVAVAREVLARTWGDTLANLYRVRLASGQSAVEVRARILTQLGSAHGLYVVTARDFRQSVQDVLDQFFAATWALEIVAALVGVIGIVNAQVASVLDRAREIAVLGAVGIPGRAIRRMVILECGQIGLVGGVVGALLGAMLAAQIVVVSLRLVTGWHMPFVLPVGVVVAGIALVTLVSAVAGAVPARVTRRLVGTPVVAE